VGLGGAVAVTGAGGLDPAWAARFPSVPKLVAGFLFPVALALILIVGAELFTSNVMFMTVGMLTGTVKWYRALLVLCCSLLTNYLGTVLCAAFSIHFAEFLASHPYIDYINALAVNKLKPTFGVIVLRAMPANILVNLAVLSATAAEDISGKILAIYLPISLFSIVGFDHLIANEFYYHLSFFNAPHIPYGTFLWKQFLASLIGNIIGGALVGLFYWYCYLSDTIPNSAKWIVDLDCCCPKKQKKSQTNGHVEEA
jgi:formate/nitrite transporter